MIPFMQKYLPIAPPRPSVHVCEKIESGPFTGLTGTQDCQTEWSTCEAEGRLIWNITMSNSSVSLRM